MLNAALTMWMLSGERYSGLARERLAPPSPQLPTSSANMVGQAVHTTA